MGVGKGIVDKTSIRDCRNIGTSDKEELDSLAEAFVHVLSSLNHHIAIRPVTPETVAENWFALGEEEKETPGRPRFDIPGEMLEEFLELVFRWIIKDWRNVGCFEVNDSQENRRIWFGKHDRISSFA